MSRTRIQRLGKKVWCRRADRVDQRGATLIELSVVVVIIALIISGSLITFRQYRLSHDITTAVEQNTRILAAILSIASATGMVNSDLYVRNTSGPNTLSVSADFSERITLLLGDANLRRSLDNAAGTLPITGGQFPAANPWGGQLELLAYSPTYIVIRHDEVPLLAVDTFVSALSGGALDIAASDAEAEAMKDNSQYNITAGSDYDFFYDLTLAGSQPGLEHVDALYHVSTVP